jgi:hypothetical protein
VGRQRDKHRRRRWWWVARGPQVSWRLWCLPKRWLWKACPILLPRWWDGMGRAQSPIIPEGRRVVWPKCNFSKELFREGLSRLDIRRRCCRSRTEGGEGPVASTKVGWPGCNCSKEPYREGLSRLDFRRRCRRSRTKVVFREGERRWGNSRVEDVDTATQNRAKSRKEQPETEH